MHRAGSNYKSLIYRKQFRYCLALRYRWESLKAPADFQSLAFSPMQQRRVHPDATERNFFTVLEFQKKDWSTSRDLHKSAPYPRLKIAKGRQSVNYSFAVPESVKYSFTVRKLGRIGTPGHASGPQYAKKGELFGFFNIHCCQISKKLKGDPLG